MDSQWREQRKYDRARIQKLVRYRVIDGTDPDHISSTKRSCVINVGGGGVLLKANALVVDGLHISYDDNSNVQNWIALEIELLPGRPSVKALGQVVWYQRATNDEEYRYDIGIEFRKIRDEDRQTIIDFVSHAEPC
ncbi:MAG: PilZ domain-containing protein [Deltaproteobacteria bacterium]|nr:PilZ domain-containing protein [Deltaproteobacteria bacterium]